MTAIETGQIIQRAEFHRGRIAKQLHPVEGIGLGRIAGHHAIAQHHAPAAAAHPHHLGEGIGRALQMMKGKAATHNVKTAIGERQRIDIALMPGDVGNLAFARDPARLIQHRRGGVDPRGMGDARSKRHHHRARPTGDIERDIAGTRARRIDQTLQRLVIVEGGRAGEIRRLTGELIGDLRRMGMIGLLRNGRTLRRRYLRGHGTLRLEKKRTTSRPARLRP